MKPFLLMIVAAQSAGAAGLAASTTAAAGTGAGVLAGATSYLASASVATSGAAMLPKTISILVPVTMAILILY